MRGVLGLAGLMLLAGCQGQPVAEAEVQAAQASPMSPTTTSATLDAAQSSSVACAANETPIFSCKLSDGKRLAVCGTAPGKAEYRYGGDTPEIVLTGGETAYAIYSGGGESQVAFSNSNTRYIVFSRMFRQGFGVGGNSPAMIGGVVVEQAGRFREIKVCRNPDVKPVDADVAERFNTKRDHLFTGETVRGDPPSA